jgi:hypothetical protein
VRGAESAGSPIDPYRWCEDIKCTHHSYTGVLVTDLMSGEGDQAPLQWNDLETQRRRDYLQNHDDDADDHTNHGEYGEQSTP